ncbi:MAG TPA: 16S rRNA (cytidine(1402)-2'-O)-methyltransferase [Sutterella sp.]|nr:16S rRNA (cytidine(1402)-2'-O)-methyltransferase [Sutterella sp.]
MSGANAQDYPEGALYVVAVPIGNMADITLRALVTLSMADLIAAEDTRETKKLLDRFGLVKPTASVREHNEATQADMIIQRLGKGQRVALVTDAGTPGISDPGAKTVSRVTQAGFRAIPIPGACAAVSAVSVSGITEGGFRFVGFLPPQAAAAKAKLASLAQEEDAFVLYESPHRIEPLFAMMRETLEAQRLVTVAREMTKRFEDIRTMSVEALATYFENDPPRGEFAIVVYGRKKEKKTLSSADLKWVEALADIVAPSKLAALAAKVTGAQRDSIYRMLQERKTTKED